MMRLAHARLTPSSWSRQPRRSARLRLALLPGGLFLLSGTALLAITYLLYKQGHVYPMCGPPPPGHPTVQQLHQFRARFPGGACADAGVAAQVAQHAAAQNQQEVDLHQLRVDFSIALIVVAVVAAFLGWFVAGRVLRPVRAIATTARRISATNLHERLALQGADDEFKQLGDTLDELLARLEAAFEAQRHFVANASHELRTPLTRERTLVQVALADPSTSEVWKATGHELLTSNREQENLIEALLTLASSEGGLDHRERADLADICKTALARPSLDTDRLALQVETAIRPAPLDGDPRLVERLVANLVDNAIRHNIVDGHIQVATAVVDGKAVLSVTNTGPVVPPGEVDRLFQPFQRLDGRRTHHKRGHGLGLSIVGAIATAHGATVTASAPPDGGLSVTVTFPAPTGPAGAR